MGADMDNKHLSNIIKHNAIVTRRKRNESNAHKSAIVWFTGLSGSGKSTLAHAVENELFGNNCKTFVLDGDNIRHGLSSNIGFNDEDRKENIRRIGEVAKLMMEAGLITMTAFISPFREDRAKVRNSVSFGDFIEIYCYASLETCENRDVKGLYKRARAGEIKNYTGIDSPYEIPEDPEIIIDTDKESLQESVAKVIELLKNKNIIN